MFVPKRKKKKTGEKDSGVRDQARTKQVTAHSGPKRERHEALVIHLFRY